MKDDNALVLLIGAIENYVEAKSERDKAEASYSGYSWGYHGQGLESRVDEATEELSLALDELIDQRIERRLKTRNSDEATP